MACYTTIEQMKREAEQSDDGVCRVWLRDEECWLRAQHYIDGTLSWYGAGFVIGEDEATKFFDSEVKTYGWVSGERRP